MSTPASFSVRSVGTIAEAQDISLASVIPLVLILMTMTGAVYPAIDSTAGERERGTMEALIATPVPRFTLLLAKYIAVVMVSVLTATANLLAMSATLYSTGLAEVLLGGSGVGLKTLLLIFLLLIVFAIFFSAVLLAVTSVARSFKEAQAYLIPLVLISLGPSLICLAPGMHLNAGLSVTPLLNLVLLAKEIFEGAEPSGWWFVVLASSVMYAVAAVAVAARVFGSDAVLYGSEQTWSDLLRRPLKSTPHISSHTTVFMLAALLPAYILVAASARAMGRRTGHDGLVAVRDRDNPVVRRATAGRRLVPTSGSSERISNWWPSTSSWIAAVLLGLSVWPILLWLAYPADSLFVRSQVRTGPGHDRTVPRATLGTSHTGLGVDPRDLRGMVFSRFCLVVVLDRCHPSQGDPCVRVPVRVVSRAQRVLGGGAVLAEYRHGLDPGMGLLAVRQSVSWYTGPRNPQFDPGDGGLF